MTFYQQLNLGLLNQIILLVMFGKDNPKGYTYHELFTETYLSSLTNREQREVCDKNVYKAIKQNNVDYLVDKDRENVVETAQLYNEQKELSAIIIEIRKKYDNEKIKTTKLEKNIASLEEQKHLLEGQIDKIQNDVSLTKNNHQNLENKHQSFEQSLEYLEYMRDIRINMGQRLKNDILHYKKESFQENIKLIRMRTIIKQLQQKDTSKKHMNSKCKLVLNSLQQTVKIRQNERDTHLKQVQTVLMRKLQNTELKTNREHELESSMYKALTQRLPEQNLLVKKFLCEQFLKKVLRNKMNNLMQEFKSVEDAFNRIRKETKISSASQFIEDYLSKEQKYGDLLNSIGKAEKKIAQEKQKYQQLAKQKSKLQFDSSQIDETFQSMHHKGRQNHQLYKKMVFYNDLTIKCEELKIMLSRWGIKTCSNMNNFQERKTQAKPMDKTGKDGQNLQSLIVKGLNMITQVLNQKNIEKQPIPSARTTEPQSNPSEGKITLRTLTESALSKQCSKKNFRVRTMTSHQQAVQEHDNEYDQLSEYDFLRFNRKIAKKNNSKSQRPRIKTKPF